jgi:hypothetical protein
MVSVLALSAADRGFEPRSGQTKDYKIGISCFSAKHAAWWRKSKDWLARNRNNVSDGVTCLPMDCCSLWKSNSACWSRTKRTSSSSHWKLICSCHDIAELALNNNHSLTLLIIKCVIVYCVQNFLCIVSPVRTFDVGTTVFVDSYLPSL